MKIYNEENTKIIFTFVERLKDIQQSEKWHPEGTVLQHTLQVVNWALKESDDVDLVLAALLHDVGKFSPKRGHAEIGAKYIEEFASVKTIWLVRNHMKATYYIEGQTRKLSKIKELVEHPWFPCLVQLYRWDKLGRKKDIQLVYNKLKIIDKLNKVVERHFPKGTDYTREDEKNEIE